MIFMFGHWRKCSQISHVENVMDEEELMKREILQEVEGISPELYTPQIRRLQGEHVELYAKFRPEDDPYAYLQLDCEYLYMENRSEITDKFLSVNKKVWSNAT